jgi:hypothetical protein
MAPGREQRGTHEEPCQHLATDSWLAQSHRERAEEPRTNQDGGKGKERLLEY